MASTNNPLPIRIAPLRQEDWDAVREIYIEGLATGLATFEVAAPDWPDWDSSHRPDCRLVAWAEGRAAGWAALSPVSRRRVYAGVAEVSIYIAAWARGQGVGQALLSELIRQAEQAGIWTLQASTFAENTASRALHQACGFREVGYRERIGQREGVWHDTILLERRSQIVGI